MACNSGDVDETQQRVTLDNVGRDQEECPSEAVSDQGPVTLTDTTDKKDCNPDSSTTASTATVHGPTDHGTTFLSMSRPQAKTLL